MRRRANCQEKDDSGLLFLLLVEQILLAGDSLCALLDFFSSSFLSALSTMAFIIIIVHK